MSAVLPKHSLKALIKIEGRFVNLGILTILNKYLPVLGENHKSGLFSLDKILFQILNIQCLYYDNVEVHFNFESPIWTYRKWFWSILQIASTFSSCSILDCGIQNSTSLFDSLFFKMISTWKKLFLFEGRFRNIFAAKVNVFLKSKHVLQNIWSFDFVYISCLSRPFWTSETWNGLNRAKTKMSRLIFCQNYQKLFIFRVMYSSKSLLRFKKRNFRKSKPLAPSCNISMSFRLSFLFGCEPLPLRNLEKLVKCAFWQICENLVGDV